MRPSQLACDRRFRATMRGRFYMHRVNAHRRGIDFELTFDQWRAIWVLSKRWPERGNRPWQYVMSRLNDVGPYAWGNVFIQLNRDNAADAWWGTERHKGPAEPVPDVVTL